MTDDACADQPQHQAWAELIDEAIYEEILEFLNLQEELTELRELCGRQANALMHIKAFVEVPSDIPNFHRKKILSYVNNVARGASA